MNAQLHHLSAKFIDFNTKIIDHIRKHQVTVSETFPSVQVEFTNENTRSNHFTSHQFADNRFGGNFNRSAYSKYVRVCIREANVSNLNSFIKEFDNCFMSIIVKKAFNRSCIEKYSVTQDSINQLVIVVSFTVPIGYSYLNAFIFPSNWTFAECVNRITHTQRSLRNSKKKNYNEQSTNGSRKTKVQQKRSSTHSQ